MRGTRFSLVLALVALVLGGAVAAPGATGKRAPKKPIGFDGTCEFSGQVRFNPPLTNTPQPTTQHARGAGSCTGTFVDRRGRSHEIKDAPTTYVATERGDQISCTSGSDSGTGRLVFKRRGSLHFTVSESRAAALAVLTLRGARGGSAIVTGNVSPSENPADVLQACGGSGLKHVALDGRLSTDGTISG